MSHHWNYFLAIEDDTERISRCVEFASPNLPVYSIEMASILMASTQEVDVLLKQICATKGMKCDCEPHYRSSVPGIYPNIVKAQVELSRFSLTFTPFDSWATNNTPSWWTANNKVKHERHNHFQKASLENMLNAVCALLISNLYYHDVIGKMSELIPGTKLLNPIDMVESISPTDFGVAPNYKVL